MSSLVGCAAKNWQSFAPLCRNSPKYTLLSKYYSPQGQVWIDKVRTCLQAALLPEVCKPATTCPILRSHAFATHPHCYVSNGFCGVVINPGNWQGLLSVFLEDPEDLLLRESLIQIVDTAFRCGSKAFGFIVQMVKKAPSFLIDYVKEKYPIIGSLL